VIARLIHYFGVVGIASIVCWAGALLALAACARSRRRTLFYACAFALSLVGLLLAEANSSRISNIQIAPPEGKRKAEEAKAEPVADTSDAPAYRQAGKHKREEGKKREVSDLTQPAQEQEAAGRTMPEADVIAADRYDRVNLFFARWVPWLALLAACFDYLSRFNRTSGYLFPLPIAGRAMDSAFRKTHSVHLRTRGIEAAKHLLEDAVRKGETFLYLGPSDPWPAPVLYRLPLRKWNLWPLRKLPCGADDASRGGGFVFDSLWFGRYCFACTDIEAARTLLGQLIGYLRMRRIPRAAAPRTVLIAWAFDSPLPDQAVAELADLCRETNFKLLLVSPDSPADDSLFEERLDLTS